MFSHGRGGMADRRGYNQQPFLCGPPIIDAFTVGEEWGTVSVWKQHTNGKLTLIYSLCHYLLFAFINIFPELAANDP